MKSQANSHGAFISRLIAVVTVALATLPVFAEIQFRGVVSDSSRTRFVLTDSDLTSYYYVESCQTLRIAVAAMLRGNSGKRGASSITAQLADHLGITEARVPKYLAEHCVVRWLQLDEGASLFAHFVIAVLRPVLNE